MLRVTITIHAEDHDAAVAVLEDQVLPKLREECIEGYVRGEDGERYHFEATAYEH